MKRVAWLLLFACLLLGAVIQHNAWASSGSGDLKPGLNSLGPLTSSYTQRK